MWPTVSWELCACLRVLNRVCDVLRVTVFTVCVRA